MSVCLGRIFLPHHRFTEDLGYYYLKLKWVSINLSAIGRENKITSYDWPITFKRIFLQNLLNFLINSKADIEISSWAKMVSKMAILLISPLSLTLISEIHFDSRILFSYPDSS